MKVFVAVEGFVLVSGFIIKEMVISKETLGFEHLTFSKQNNIELSDLDEKTVKYVSTFLSGLDFNNGCVPYSVIDQILAKIPHCEVFCYGLHTQKFLKPYLPDTIICDLSGTFKLPKQLPNYGCGRFHMQHRYCALSKSLYIRRLFLAYDKN